MDSPKSKQFPISARYSRYRWHIVLLVFMSILPFALSAYWIGVLITGFVYAIMAMSFDMIYGYAGQLNLGIAAFVGIGAYASALVTQYFSLPTLLGLGIGAGFSLLFSFLIGFPSLRVKGPYLALTTLMTAEVIRYFVTNEDWLTGGAMGIVVRTPLTFLPRTDRVAYYFFALALALVCLVTLYKLGSSWIGLSLRAMKDDEDAAQSLGLNTTKLKLFVFSVGAIFPGIAGAFYAHYLGFISPELFSPAVTFLATSMAIFGGKSTIVGPFFGAIGLAVLTEYLRPFGEYTRFIAFGLLVVFTILFVPEGIYGYVRKRRMK